MLLPHSHYLAWDADDREALDQLHGWQAERCPECQIHPSVWNPKLGGNRNAVVAEWRFCRVCELIGQARAAGPPTDQDPPHGWHLALNHNPT